MTNNASCIQICSRHSSSIRQKLLATLAEDLGYLANASGEIMGFASAIFRPTNGERGVRAAPVLHVCHGDRSLDLSGQEEDIGEKL